MKYLKRAKVVAEEEGYATLMRKIPRYIPLAIGATLRRQFKSEKTVEEWQRNFSEHGGVDIYAEIGTDETSYWLEEMVSRHSTQQDDTSVLELGANVGRHLNAFHERGYENVHGVEINQDALDKMADVYPDLYETATLHPGAFESVLPALDREFDVIYSVGVLMHVHDDSEFIFDEISDLSNDLLLTVEEEESERVYISEYKTARNYKGIFESRGFTQVHELELNDDGAPLGDNFNERFTARVFKR